MRPRVLIHNAISVDGRTDWFKANIEKFYDLTSNWTEDATLAGSDTILTAYAGEVIEPTDELDEVNAVESDDGRPLLFVPDSRGRIRMWHMLKREPYWRSTIAICSRSTPQEYLQYLEKEKVEYIIAGEDRVDFRQALEEINAKYGVNHIRVDSGGTLNGVLLREGLVDEVSVLIHPYLVGGISPRSLYRAPDLASEDGVIKLHLLKVNLIENELIWAHYEVVREEQAHS